MSLKVYLILKHCTAVYHTPRQDFTTQESYYDNLKVNGTNTAQLIYSRVITRI